MQAKTIIRNMQSTHVKTQIALYTTSAMLDAKRGNAQRNTAMENQCNALTN